MSSIAETILGTDESDFPPLPKRAIPSSGKGTIEMPQSAPVVVDAGLDIVRSEDYKAGYKAGATEMLKAAKRTMSLLMFVTTTSIVASIVTLLKLARVF